MATEEEPQKTERRPLTAKEWKAHRQHTSNTTRRKDLDERHGRGRVKAAPGMFARPTVGVAEAEKDNLWELEQSKKRIARLESGGRVCRQFIAHRKKVGRPVQDENHLSLEDAKRLAVHLCLVRKIKPKTAEILVRDALRYQSQVLGQTTIASDPEKMK
ncbi:hypothetical protein PROFUN_16079 [Planoprotostelium fungivorum]|uniref:Uncharacterized protein n=1 Tax=Planoprotostelium fungivorum TaxID=1890364 RepID=A0A2P6MXD1_9EUKA|nr:hypothetical protein PROFUN_16079 [Planoprotostelium fungivorum]